LDNLKPGAHLIDITALAIFYFILILLLHIYFFIPLLQVQL
jgi:hypothetical protein